MQEPNISATTRRIGLVSHLVFWAFVAEWFLELTGTSTHLIALVLFVVWCGLRTLWYQRMRIEGAIGVSWSEALAAFVFVACAVGLMLIPLGVPLAAIALPLKVACLIAALYVIGRGVARGIHDARTP